MMLGAATIRRIGYLTQGEMLKARYSFKTAKMLSVMILIFMTFSAASQMVGIGDFFGTYLGLDYEIAVMLGAATIRPIGYLTQGEMLKARYSSWWF